MLTAYDAPTAALLEEAGLDFILVGDSLGMVLLGYASTLPVTMDEMIHHAKAVRRGAPKSFVVGDLPYKGVVKGPGQTLASARRFMKEAGCSAVKFEWNAQAVGTTKLLVKNKIPVIGHVGLTPQTAAKKGGYRVQGQTATDAAEILKKALLFQEAGAFAVLLECVPVPVAREVTRRLRVPTIGIGAGPYCDGQVLVFYDMIGFSSRLSLRFVKRFANMSAAAKKAIERYQKEVKEGIFPKFKHGFKMKREEEVLFRTLCNSI